MKNIIILIASVLAILSFNSCGRKVNDYFYQQVVPQDFEGVYYFDNGGSIELLTASDGEVTILSQGQLLVSTNPQNDTFGTHPKFSAVGLEPQRNELRLVKDLNYNAGQDLEEDQTGNNITGKKKTEILIEMLDYGKLRITIKIYSDSINNNANYVIAVRTFTSL
tara:strand:- start:968 stop:1462 length:495 start_codon:yes stop_codon:yes gene_type:complete